MINGLFWGCLLTTAGPPFVLYCGVIARQSFLILLSLASCFYWLVTFLLISAVFRGFLPIQSPLAYILVTLVSVVIQETARYGLWTLHRKSVTALDLIAQRRSDMQLTERNKHAMAVTHGFAHGICQSALLCISWLPLSLGGATYYLSACPAMSYFFATALLSLGTFLFHVASMVIAFEGWGRSKTTLMALPPCLHLVLSLLTVANLASNACLAVVPLVLACGAGVSVLAAKIALESLKPGYERLDQPAMT